MTETKQTPDEIKAEMVNHLFARLTRKSTKDDPSPELSISAAMAIATATVNQIVKSIKEQAE